MPNSKLRAWLDHEDTEFRDTLKTEVRQHVAHLRQDGAPFYGYAILPGETYSIDTIVAAFNREADVKPADANANNIYYRYSVDEWSNYCHDGFFATNKLLATINARFEELHTKSEPDNCLLDEWEIAHIDKLLNSILAVLLELRREQLFDETQFMIIWIPNSDADIVFRSASMLNSNALSSTFLSEFGS